MRMSKDQKFGLYWEKWALCRLHELGFTDARLVSDWFADVDIMLGSTPVEVKAANKKRQWTGRYNRYRWQFDVSRLPKWSDSLVILVAVDQGTPYLFVCPSWLLYGRWNVHITSHPTFFRGRLASCLENWANVALVQRVCLRYFGQMTLWEMGTGVTPIKSLSGDAELSRLAIQMGLSPVPAGVTP